MKIIIGEKYGNQRLLKKKVKKSEITTIESYEQFYGIIAELL